LKQALAQFPSLTALPVFFPVSPNCFPADQFAPASTCGGLGPYRIVAWNPGISIELEANPGYPGPAPRMPTVLVRYFDSAGDLRQALEGGDIDVAWKDLAATDYQELGADPKFRIATGDGPLIRFLCFNTTLPPFDDVAVRTGLAAAADRESMAHEVFSDTMSALYSMVPEGIWSHRAAFLDLYGQRNLAETRRLLQQAGYSESNKLALDLWYPLEHYGPLEPDFAAALATDLEESGMVSVTLHGIDWRTYHESIASGTLPAFLLGWYPDYLDPDTYTWFWAHSTASDDSGIYYSNPAMDALLEAARATLPGSSSDRQDIYVDIQELAAEEAPTIPLLQRTLLAVTQDRIRDVLLSPEGTLPYYMIWRDTSVAQTIGVEGGSLTSYDESTSVQVPPGAIAEPIVMTHTPTSGPLPGGNLASIGHDFDLTAVYSDTGQPAQIEAGQSFTIEIDYGDAGAVIEDTLGLYWWDEGAEDWSQAGISSTVDVEANMVTAAVDHLSLFAFLGETNRVYLPVVLKGR
jgi:peptide/nickel transport system substrate-binding protein